MVLAQTHTLGKTAKREHQITIYDRRRRQKHIVLHSLRKVIHNTLLRRIIGRHALLALLYEEGRSIGSATGITLDKVGYGSQKIGTPHIVAIEQSHPFCCGSLDAHIAGYTHATICLTNNPHRRCGHTLHNIATAIGRAIINDNNLDLIRTYNTVRDRAKELVAELKKIQKEFLPLDEEERHEYFNEMRDEFNARLSDGLRHSALFIFLNKTSNANYRVNAEGKFNGAYNHLQFPLICDERTIYADSKLLQRVIITCGDYEKTYSEACGNTFFFLDPPYRPTGKRHHHADFNDKEQIRLKKFCDLLSYRHFQWMLTNSDGKCQDPDDTFMEQLYSNYNVERIWSRQAIVAKPEKRDKLSELLVRNFQQEILSLRNVNCRQLSLAF